MWTKSVLRTFVRKVAWRAFVWAENLNNTQMEQNGEEYFLAHLPQAAPFVFFDVGANRGEYSLRVLNKIPKAEGHLFEPSSECSEYLSSLFESRGQIFINDCALSDVSGMATLWFDHPGSALASLYQRDLKEHHLELDKSSNVQTTTLEAYIEAKGIKHVNLLKIDVEGHELQVLKGAGQYLNPDFLDCIQFEYGGCGLDSMTSLRSLYRLLEMQGFELYKMMPSGLLKRKYSLFMENFQNSNYMALSPKFI